jgi:hypothetical protein
VKELGRVIFVRLEGLEQLAELIAFELSEYLVQYGGFALPRADGVAVDLSLSPFEPSLDSLAHVVKGVLDRSGLEGDYVTELGGDEIHVKAVPSERLRRVLEKHKARAKVEVCPHCGFTSPYPEIMREHIKIHYLL